MLQCTSKTESFHMSKAARPGKGDQASLPLTIAEFPKPDFAALLRKPALKSQLPPDFDIEKEAHHLDALWDQIAKLRRYKFGQFIFAGGSSTVWRVSESGSKSKWSLKVARAKFFEPTPSRPILTC